MASVKNSLAELPPKMRRVKMPNNQAVKKTVILQFLVNRIEFLTPQALGS